MKPLLRALRTVHLLTETTDGLTLEELAQDLGGHKRTVQRLLKTLIAAGFNIEEIAGESPKRLRIPDRLNRAYTIPSAEEVAALEAEVTARGREGAGHAGQLAALLAKIKSTFDTRERNRIAPDLDALVRLQRTRIEAGPLHEAGSQALVVIQHAILAGNCVEFDYAGKDGEDPQWRRVIPYGLVHGPTTYLVGKLPPREGKAERPPVYYRLDRMRAVHLSNHPGCAPDDWDLDAWISTSFGIWQGEAYDIVLRALPSAVERARHWRFHPAQTLEPDGEDLLIKFRAAGLREIAEHVFTWGGDIRIEAPEELCSEMHTRVMLAMGSF
ncbi:helix-turn-helix transcriptional regulator [Novosphingobium decolorationis]|uniref:WYL domain-containing transcriptional regulator n=1 Tax=Novosphingobium decolorationis TaxID=2698673 RepID=A0ABX8E7K7_9SPHN|nr:WYL domain-containing transcriptional regulator [Novosphingobium decolorationis]QVM85170.1 WYL domain-containing transcriptional regulator [Novosphingobium decolorationis]